jgi:hypothetical protein
MTLTNNVIYIYALIDPRTMEIRYIGKTNNPKERMRAHLSPHIFMRTINAKRMWIEELLAYRVRPIMQVLCTCKPEESEIYEYRYYKLFKDSCDLLNSATINETYQYELNF